MNPKEFLLEYPVCPKCGYEFKQNLMLFTENMVEPCFVRSYVLKDHDIKISMDAPGYPNRLDFSVNYHDGNVKLYNNTKWDDFVANEPLTMTLDFSCENCSIFDHRGFYISFFGKTMPGHVFNFARDMAYFQYTVDEVLYAVQSDFENGKTILEIHKLNLGIHSKLELPIIELNVFDFSDKIKMKEKLDTIMILA